MYIIVDFFGGPEYAHVVTDWENVKDPGWAAVFKTRKEAEAAAEDVQVPLIVEVPE